MEELVKEKGGLLVFCHFTLIFFIVIFRDLLVSDAELFWAKIFILFYLIVLIYIVFEIFYFF